jgi:hypothetical protein
MPPFGLPRSLCEKDFEPSSDAVAYAMTRINPDES